MLKKIKDLTSEEAWRICHKYQNRLHIPKIDRCIGCPGLMAKIPGVSRVCALSFVGEKRDSDGNFVTLNNLREEYSREVKCIEKFIEKEIEVE